MQNSVLNTIVNEKKAALQLKKQTMPLETFKAALTPSDRDFYTALSSQRIAFILECKKASPSKGLLRADFDVQEIANVYKNYAQVISVLTEEAHFQGDYENISKVRAIAPQPILCKDFIVETYQIYLARHYGADAVLLMLSILDETQYLELMTLAHVLNMGVLTEVNNEQELALAVKHNAKVIGINNRNLKDLSVSLSITKDLAPKVPEGCIIISESGIQNHHHVRELAPLVNGFLIGSSLMTQAHLDTAVRKVIYGENKVCGLTQPTDAQCVYEQNFVYGGLIFVPSSPRQVSLADAQTIQKAAPLLSYVGVFQNERIDQVANIAHTLALAAVQLHGDEDQNYIDQLKNKLPQNCKIWKALPVKDRVPAMGYQHIDTYVLDNKQGGSGQTFEWALLDGTPLNNVMLAGGLNQNNCHEAMRMHPQGLDFNSGVETGIACKDHVKIRFIHQQLHHQLQHNL